MGIRKNAKYLTSTERADFVRACIMMKADIVNPGASPANRYSHWDEYVAIHRMIQNANAPGTNNVNFGHGGSGAFSFLSWHRYFLLQFELQLQSYVPNVMLPYWDWTDPSSIMTDTFLGPDGNGSNIVTSGYFAEDTPGTGSNPTPAPAWWPAGLNGWNLHSAMGPTWEGPLRRNLGGLGGLPTVAQIRLALDKTTFSTFQNALESGAGVTGTQLHNGIHGWISGHMGNATASPFDPIFYLHHCNIDRLWAMWQMDGHAGTYPTTGGDAEHHRNDIMYPWTGGTPGYSTNINFNPIVMPDFSALGVQRNVDTLDHRALGYTYDTLPVVGVSLDRTGSMTQMTPDPMTVAAPDVTKWEAAKRGVSAFFQDCESAYQSNEAYVFTGVETFRSLAGNEFDPVFSPSSGLIKSGGAYSQAAFDSAISSVTPGGGTPLADALTHADASLVKGPFSNLPADERRYLAILTDGKRTSGSTIASIPDGSLGDTVVFAMGFGTGADVDYVALQQLADKGSNLSFNQVYHGDSAGTIDKFYTDSLAAAIDYVPAIDPVLELFAGEHSHVDFHATSADDGFFISAQGMDFTDPHWSFKLIGPDDYVLHGKNNGKDVTCDCEKRRPQVNFKRSNGRLSLFVQRDSASDDCWIGRWQFIVAYKSKDMSHMMMMPDGAMLAPVSTGPLRGPRYFRPLSKRGQRSAARLVNNANTHALDLIPPMTSADKNDACNALVNIYTRTRLKVNLISNLAKNSSFQIQASASVGTVSALKAYGRYFSPQEDMVKLFSKLDSKITKGTSLRGSTSLKYDTSKILAKLESEKPGLFKLNDEIVKFKTGKDGQATAKVDKKKVPGVHHIGVMIEGVYHPDGDEKKTGERFTRLLTLTEAVSL